jgi:hypothetical protein
MRIHTPKRLHSCCKTRLHYLVESRIQARYGQYRHDRRVYRLHRLTYTDKCPMKSDYQNIYRSQVLPRMYRLPYHLIVSLHRHRHGEHRFLRHHLGHRHRLHLQEYRSRCPRAGNHFATRNRIVCFKAGHSVCKVCTDKGTLQKILKRPYGPI